MTTICSFNDLTDGELLAEVKRLTAAERQATARLVASLAEVDARRLYLGEGCSCLFTYCVQVLHLSEHAAYNRIEAARAARRFPVILERLNDGSLHLTAIRLLAPKLTPGNHRALLDAAGHKSKREVEHLIAELNPRLISRHLFGSSRRRLRQVCPPNRHPPAICWTKQTPSAFRPPQDRHCRRRSRL